VEPRESRAPNKGLKNKENECETRMERDRGGRMAMISAGKREINKDNADSVEVTVEGESRCDVEGGSGYA
jgi:hypothetical protein